MKKLLYIARYPALAFLLMLLLALAPAKAQNVTNKGEITDLLVNPLPGDVYSWELYSDSTLDFAVSTGITTSDTFAEFVGGNTGAKVKVLWKEIGTYFFKVTATNAAGCTDNIAVGIMKVKPPLPVGTLTTLPICSGDPAKLTVDLTEGGPWSFTYTDGTTTWTETNVLTTPWVVTVSPGPHTTTDFWISTVTNPNGMNIRPSVHVPLVVNPKPKSSVIYLYEP
ncbi:MAG: hypothetical protein WCI54_05595 [Bacteroidia bacterium]